MYYLVWDELDAWTMAISVSNNEMQGVWRGIEDARQAGKPYPFGPNKVDLIAATNLRVVDAAGLDAFKDRLLGKS